MTTANQMLSPIKIDKILIDGYSCELCMESGLKFCVFNSIHSNKFKFNRDLIIISKNGSNQTSLMSLNIWHLLKQVDTISFFGNFSTKMLAFLVQQCVFVKSCSFTYVTVDNFDEILDDFSSNCLKELVIFFDGHSSILLNFFNKLGNQRLPKLIKLWVTYNDDVQAFNVSESYMEIYSSIMSIGATVYLLFKSSDTCKRNIFSKAKQFEDAGMISVIDEFDISETLNLYGKSAYTSYQLFQKVYKNVTWVMGCSSESFTGEQCPCYEYDTIPGVHSLHPFHAPLFYDTRIKQVTYFGNRIQILTANGIFFWLNKKFGESHFYNVMATKATETFTLGCDCNFPGSFVNLDKFLSNTTMIRVHGKINGFAFSELFNYLPSKIQSICLTNLDIMVEKSTVSRFFQPRSPQLILDINVAKCIFKKMNMSLNFLKQVTIVSFKDSDDDSIKSCITKLNDMNINKKEILGLSNHSFASNLEQHLSSCQWQTIEYDVNGQRIMYASKRM